MAIVVYKCDICKREKEYPRNIKGLERIQRCTITHGCRGKLYQVELLDDYTRPTSPSSVIGLDNWQQRKVLYNHPQTIASEQWVIKHNLGTFASVSVFVNIPIEGNPSNLVEVLPIDTIVVDKNNMILVFDKPWAGLAQLVARQSDPDLFKSNTVVEADNGAELLQMSVGGEITVATRVSTIGQCSSVSLGVTYTTTQNIEVTTVYSDVNINLPDAASPWRDFDTVLINGKIYSVRSFQGVYQDMQDNTVATGSTLRFTNITPCTTGSPPPAPYAPNTGEVLILLASSPFESVDKLTDRYVDVSKVTSDNNTFSFVYDTGEFYTKNKVIQTTYPLIRRI